MYEITVSCLAFVSRILTLYSTSGYIYKWNLNSVQCYLVSILTPAFEFETLTTHFIQKITIHPI